MKQALKRVLFAVMVCVMAAGHFSVFAAYSETVTPVIRDVDLIKVTNTTSAGRQNITMVRANLNNPNLALKTLFSPSGAGTLANVQQLADAHNAVAAVNADFFSWGSEAGTGSAVGYNVVNGQIVSSPCITEDVAAVATNLNGESLFAYFQRSMTITAPSGESAPIKHINKYDDLTGIVLYTPDWGKYSLGSHGTLVEVVVADGIVQEVRADMPPAEIPQNGYILAGLTDQTNFLTQVVHVGDKLQLDVKITPEFDTHNAVGGGTILVTNGKEAKITHNIAGRQPRSAFGVDKTGKVVYLITVDGRGAGGSIGMTLEELRTFMLDVGIYNGINFDGGGSTQMVMRPDGKGDSTIINTPSQAPYRKVINALGIVLTGKAGIPEWVKVVPEMPTMFVNTGIDMSTILYDQQYNVMDNSDTAYTVEGVAGSMDTGRFVPTTSGNAVITAKTGGLYGTATVRVEPYPMRLMIDSDQYTMRRGEKKKITMRALTVNNEVIYVNSMYAKFTQTNPILKAVDGGLEAVAEGVTDITFQLGDVTATARVVVNDNPDIVEVEYNNGTDRFEYSNGGVYVYPSEVIGFYKISEEQAAEGSYSGKLWYDFLPDLGAVQSAGFNLTKPMLIDKPDSVVNIDVHAESGNQQWLRMIITDANGELHRMDLAEKVNWDGWKNLTARIPSSIPLPAKLTRIYLVQPNKDLHTKGPVYFDNLFISQAEGTSLAVTAGISEENILLNQITRLRLKEKLYQSDFSLNLTDTEEAYAGNIAAGALNKTVEGNITILQLKDITEANLEENALWLESQMAGLTTQAVVITANQNPFENKAYQERFQGIVAAQTDKKIYQLYLAEKMEESTANGVIRIGLPSVLPSITNNRNTAYLFVLTQQKESISHKIETYHFW